MEAEGELLACCKQPAACVVAHLARSTHSSRSRNRGPCIAPPHMPAECGLLTAGGGSNHAAAERKAERARPQSAEQRTGGGEPARLGAVAGGWLLAGHGRAVQRGRRRRSRVSRREQARRAPSGSVALLLA